MVEVLLVEDNPDDVDLALLALEDHHVANRIQVVRDGAEALDFLFCRGDYAHRSPGNRPRVVLLDLKLPRVDGLEVLRQIRADARTRHIPVIMLTASQEEKDRIRSYENGANSYIVKPVDFDQFKEAISAIGYYWLLLNEPPPDTP